MSYEEMIINRINQLCQQRQLSYYRLSQMCGLNQSTIDNIVRGVTKNPRVQTLHHIAIGLSMTLSEFLDFDELNNYCFDENNINE